MRLHLNHSVADENRPPALSQQCCLSLPDRIRAGGDPTHGRCAAVNIYNPDRRADAQFYTHRGAVFNARMRTHGDRCDRELSEVAPLHPADQVWHGEYWQAVNVNPAFRPRASQSGLVDPRQHSAASATC